MFGLIFFLALKVCSPNAGNYEDTETTSCVTTECPVNGTWGVWGAWSTCSKTCNNGIQTRYRSCDNPVPAHGGSDCLGMNLEMTSCFIIPCPVNGTWGVWGAWSTCSKTCDKATRTRYRACDNPAPAHEGKECTGNKSVTTTCFIIPCPVNGTWGLWGAWGPCTKTCDDGIWKRHRSCDNPAPAHGGSNCQGSTNATTTCYTTCPAVNGKWGTWGDWSPCTTTCGGGLLIRYRPCNNPPPENAGLYCLGRAYEKESCSTLTCPVSTDNTGSMAIGIGAGIGSTAVLIGLLILSIEVLKWYKLKKQEENACAICDTAQASRSTNFDLHVYSGLEHDTNENTCTLYDTTDASRSTSSDIHVYSGLEHDTSLQNDCEPPTQRKNDVIYSNMMI